MLMSAAVRFTGHTLSPSALLPLSLLSLSLPAVLSAWPRVLVRVLAALEVVRALVQRWGHGRGAETARGATLRVDCCATRRSSPSFD